MAIAPTRFGLISMFTSFDRRFIHSVLLKVIIDRETLIYRRKETKAMKNVHICLI